MPLADRRRAQWKALTPRGRNTEEFLNSALKKRETIISIPALRTFISYSSNDNST